MIVNKMIRTRHFEQRLNQRAIHSKQIEFALELGAKSYDGKVTLGRKQIDKELGLIEEAKKTLLELRKKGGLVVVEEDGVLITAYPKTR